MNYELAKKLKEAGFANILGRIPFRSYEHNGEMHFYDDSLPTLEELIEACGENFKQLNFHMNSKRGHKRWTAKVRTNTIPRYANYDGSTPLEAVANLWLATNSPH
jgi:hypothetical protein